MKTEHLLYLLDLMQSGSMTKTAEHFFTSHQVISKAIRNLEKELNVKLISTSNQGVTCTSAGAILVKYAEELLQTIDCLKMELEPFSLKKEKKEKDVIELCITPYLTDSLILNFVNKYQAKKPEIVFELTSLPFESMLPKIGRPNSIFIVPTVIEALKEKKFLKDLEKNKLDYFVLAERPIYACAYVKSKWAKYEKIQENDLSNLPVIVSSNITLRKNFLNQTNQQVVNSIEAQKNLIEMGVGIGVFTKKEFEFYLKNENKYVLIPIEGSPIQYVCIRKNTTEIPEFIQEFLEELRECF